MKFRFNEPNDYFFVVFFFLYISIENQPSILLNSKRATPHQPTNHSFPSTSSSFIAETHRSLHRFDLPSLPPSLLSFFPLLCVNLFRKSLTASLLSSIYSIDQSRSRWPKNEEGEGRRCDPPSGRRGNGKVHVSVSLTSGAFA